MNDQATELRRQLEYPKTPRHAKTISVVSGKGGVGKSNFALNLSLELINKQKKVLLIDLDVGMGNINILLGLHAEQTIIDMLDNLLPIQDIIEVGPNNLAFISGGSAVTNFFTMNETRRTYFFTQFTKLVSEYDFIIFDIGAGATSESMFFVLASDESIVITTPEPTSITDAYGMIKHIINKRRNMPIYVVMNRCYSQKSGLKSLDKFQQVVAKFLQVEINKLGTLPEDKFVSTAVMQQTPYIILNEKAAISKAIKKVCTNYLTHSTEGNNLQTKNSFVQRLTQFFRER